MSRATQNDTASAVVRPGEAALLQSGNLTRLYGALRAVDDLSFDLHSGEVLGIGGPNGAGKTTLFDLVSGLTKTTAGQIRLDGQDVTDLTPDERCRLGIARTFQLNAAFDGLTALENVQVAALFGGRENRLLPRLFIDAATRRKSLDALDRVGLAHRATASVDDMPVLERKLLMIAGAIVTEPRLLMMDEPVGGLTPSEIELVQDVVEGLKGDGLTILLIEHVMHFLMALSDRVLIMHHGSKLFEGLPEEVAKDPEVIRVYLGKKATDRLQQWFVGQARHD